MHVPTLCDWFTSSASACDNDHPVFHYIVKFYASDYDSDPDSDSVASENQPYSELQQQNTLSFLMAEDLATHPAIYCSKGTLLSLINKDKLQSFNFENPAFSAIAAVWGNDLCLR